MILYDIIDNEADDENENSVFEDEISKEKLEALHKVYPFCRNSEEGTIFVPNWAKEILYQRMTLNKAIKVIKYFNYGGDAQNENEQPLKKKISHLALENIDIKMMNDIQFSQLKGEDITFRIHQKTQDQQNPQFVDKVQQCP